MKVKRLGIEWGAAYQEAQPIQITHNDTQVIVYIKENGDLQLDLPAETNISWCMEGLVATIQS